MEAMRQRERIAPCKATSGSMTPIWAESAPEARLGVARKTKWPLSRRWNYAMAVLNASVLTRSPDFRLPH